MVGDIGSTEVILLVLVFFALFGVERIPSMARTLGRARAEVARSIDDVRRPLDVQRTLDDLDRGGRTELVDLAERSRAHGIDPAGQPIEELRQRVEARESAEEA